MRKNALVIGATGLLGQSLTNGLCESGWNVRAVARTISTGTNMFSCKNVEYMAGDISDDDFLSMILKDIDKVFCFVSSTFPYSSDMSLECEINYTLVGLDLLIRKMLEMGTKQLVFPSSGGTIYGNIDFGLAKENMVLKPSTPYGMGKLLCEEVIEYYSKFGLSSTILRVGNVYGSPVYRNKNQGVIDIFVQKALNHETATIWGNALENIRDYIFLDDFTDAVVKIANINDEGVAKYNLSSGVGTKLQEIIDIIDRYASHKLDVNVIENKTASSINRIVLDISNIRNKLNWIPQYDIESGIKETINRKQNSIS